MSLSKTVLVTGGAGYIGSILTRKLYEKNYKVKILDSLVYGDAGIYDLISKNTVEFVKGDLRNEKFLENELRGCDYVIHLAAIVGDPLCKKIPIAAKQINELATKKLVKICRTNEVKRLVFASTCSNYGSSSKKVSEESSVHPLSLYSETKVNSEKFILESNTSKFNACVLRFATAFGLSPRMRFDLLLHEFIRDAIMDKEIVVFGPNYWRPLVHVADIAKACILALETEEELFSRHVYNVGSDSENYTKIQLAEIVTNYLPSKIKVKELKKDPRNYKVSFDKIKSNLGFSITKNVEDGVCEIVEKINSGELDPRESEFSNMSKHTEKIRAF